MNGVKQVLACVCLLAAAGLAAAGQPNVTVDRQTLRVNETFVLTFEYGQELSGEPDFSPLDEDFEILTQNVSTKISSDGTVTEYLRQWELLVMPKRGGKLTVPPVKFGADHSDALTLNVLPAAPGDPDDSDIALQVELDLDEVYVQAQLVYTVRLQYTVRMAEARLTEPEAVDNDIIVQALDDGRRYDTMRGGKRVSVYEKRYAVFPQRSGPLRFAPVQFDGLVRERGWRNRPRRVLSRELAVDVLPVPASFSGRWLPAADLALIESWQEDPPRFEVGTPVTRTLILRVQGQSGEQLPTLEQALPEGLRQYADQPSTTNELQEDGLVGIRQDKLAVVPNEPGEFELPAIEIPWWDTAADRARVARLPARRINVLPAAAVPTQSVAAVDEAVAETAAAVPDWQAQPLLLAATGVLAFGWAATGLGWWWSNRRPRRRKAPPQNAHPGGRRVRRDLRTACCGGDPAAARSALLAWSAARWGPGDVTNLRELGRRVGGPLQTEVERLSRVLYGEDLVDWQGGPLWEAFEALSQREAGGRAPAAPRELATL